jgi:hypothetical protein
VACEIAKPWLGTIDGREPSRREKSDQDHPRS